MKVLVQTATALLVGSPARPSSSARWWDFAELGATVWRTS
jgi:hypothetical protein